MKSMLKKISLLAAALAATSSTFAATFVVSNLGDSGPGTLRQAILDANANAGEDTITFSVTGTITLATNLDAITDSATITGPGTNLLTINGAGLYSAFWMKGGNSNSVSDLTISSTRTQVEWYSGYNPRTNASGIHSDGALLLRRCVITNAQSLNSWGGAICSRGSLDAEACALLNCRPPSMSQYQSTGGGIYNFGPARIKDCHISQCGGGSSSGSGGGIYSSNSTLHLLNTRIEKCYAGDAGGIDASGTLVMNDCVIAGNAAYYYYGGISSGPNVAITNTFITANTANDWSGGLSVAGQAVLSGCTVSSNRCSIAGAGILNYGDLKMYNCTVSRNNGGIPNYSMGTGISDNKDSATTATTYLNHCTVISNGGPAEVYARGTFTVANSIIATCKGALNSEGHNLIVSNGVAVITNNLTGNLYNVDPQLGPLQNNGGPTLTHALLPGSPALNSANDDGLLNDQRGAPHSSGADIGSFESVQVVIPNLNIQLTDPTHVTVSWPTTPAPLVLQQKADLGAGSWSDINSPPLNNGGSSSITLPTDANGKFYRLRNP